MVISGYSFATPSLSLSCREEGHADHRLRLAQGRGRKNHLGLSASRPPLAALYDVTVIDADPNHPIETWANGGNAPTRLTIVSDVDEDKIIERIEDAAAKTPFVVVDLEGTASKIVVYAISQADFVDHSDAGLAARCQ